MGQDLTNDSAIFSGYKTRSLGLIMIITLDTKTVEIALKEGLLKLGIVSKSILDKSEIRVYRKGKQVAAKLILK